LVELEIASGLNPLAVFLLGQGPVFDTEFFADPKNGESKTKKPPAMRVVGIALAYNEKPPMVQ